MRLKFNRFLEVVQVHVHAISDETMLSVAIVPTMLNRTLNWVSTEIGDRWYGIFVFVFYQATRANSVWPSLRG